MSQDGRFAYFVVVHGIDVPTFEQMAVHFECRRGGMRPTDESRYITIPVTLDAIGSTLTWVKAELDGCYRELYLMVSVEAELSWSEVVIPAEIALLAGQSKAAIKVLLANSSERDLMAGAVRFGVEADGADLRSESPPVA
ncbi:hypothetical protein O0880_20885 [Janthinobacterium sp. SUN118]|uniref:hypothetical protein n=1 Tax=Janthinobacterium sp. SUN118 TaxID=3004100 RepID=UPI0025B18B45|nr:hypothetical protein [Janthinobacterium sp. SUN118]MDN2711884.1 hypothetical protein [Janthinobacterium sp. SUN118]